MATFDIAIAQLLPVEGGLNNDSADRGGLTKYGISQKQFPDVDIKNLTLDDAKTIYQKKYWDAFRIGEIKDQILANYVFDMFVNHNGGDAAKIIQKGCDDFEQNSVQIDGVIGSGTLKFINDLGVSDIDYLLDKIKLRRIEFYLRIITRDRTQLPNIISWLGRALS